MAIPKHDEIRLPALSLLNDSEILKLKDFEAPLSKHFNLTEAEVTEMYSSGNGPVFYDRVSWALSYLNMAGLVIKPKRGFYQISELGRKLLKTPDEINTFIEAEFKKREASKPQKPTEKFISQNDTFESEELTPQEGLYKSFASIKASVYNEILSTILSKTPIEFEKLVVSLLQKMGYGGEISDSGLVTKASNDGGIDGIIKEDVLGLGRIYIQAKRYKLDSGIGREEIQKFVGALAVAQSNKGVFITTSYYSKGAIEYVLNLNGATTIVLIDGNKLAEYIYDYGLGMQVEQTIEIKKLDSDFWDTMKDEIG